MLTKCGIRPDEMPRSPYSSLAGTPSVTQLICSWRPASAGNWIVVEPPVRFGPNAPLPFGLGVGSLMLFGSWYDAPRVWQRAQLSRKRISPSLIWLTCALHAVADATTFAWLSTAACAAAIV